MPPPMEPAADIRTASSAMRQLFVALTNDGFSERQALTILGYMLAASIGRQDGESS